MGRVQEGYRCVPRAVLTDGHFFLGPLLRAYVSRHDSGSSRQGAQGRPRPAQDVRLEPGVRAIWGVGAHPAFRARRPSPPHPRRRPRPRLVRRSTASTPVRTPAELALALADHQDAKAKAKAAKREEATSKVRPRSPRPHPSPPTPPGHPPPSEQCWRWAPYVWGDAHQAGASTTSSRVRAPTQYVTGAPSRPHPTPPRPADLRRSFVRAISVRWPGSPPPARRQVLAWRLL